LNDAEYAFDPTKSGWQSIWRAAAAHRGLKAHSLQSAMHYFVGKRIHLGIPLELSDSAKQQTPVRLSTTDKVLQRDSGSEGFDNVTQGAKGFTT